MIIMEKARVYFTKDLSSNGLIKIYQALGRKLNGKVAVKISSGEPGGHNYLDPNLIEPLVTSLHGTIVECNTAYEGKRTNNHDHWEAIINHGFTKIAPCDIMDENGEMEIPVKNGQHLKGHNIVGKHLSKYDSMLVLSHFKGHQMAGMGGALKNMAIGIASRNGKAWIHSGGYTTDPDILWSHLPAQDIFLESMAEAVEGVMDYLGKENMVYINVANKLSIDCDCDSNPHAPEMKDIGIFASLDPVAVDQACYDAIMNSSDKGKASLVNRMNEKHAIHTVEEAARLGLGIREYEIIELK
jgi:uncharacterized protein